MIVDVMTGIFLVVTTLGVVTTLLFVVVGGCGTTFELIRLHRDALDDHRRRRGLCVQCGYDLRGSTSRCPECGRPFGRPLTMRSISP